MLDETRARFLASIAKQVPTDRVAEVHLFPAIRQGGMESGVAVLALDLAPPPADAAPASDALDADASPAEPTAGDALADLASSDDLPLELLREPESDDEAEPLGDEPSPRAPAPRRYTVYTARYRHTLKGMDRGKWEVSVTEEADAPLLTVDAVVRGVQRRSGDVDEIVRISGDEMRAMLPVPTAQPA